MKASPAILRGDECLKPLLLAALGNMFTRYMCSMRFSYSDHEFQTVIRNFDEIFWDINQGYLVDFMPWLSPFYKRHMTRLSDWATEIRSFILNRIIDRHRASLDTINGIPRDFTDALLLHLESPESGLSWEHIIYELEDFLGGHSAIGNLTMLILANLAVNQEAQSRVQREIDETLLAKAADNKKTIDLDDKPDMPFTEAVVWETLRISSSPIVPHVANVNTEIGGYEVLRDSVVFVNNYELNLGVGYWGQDALDFRPERFLREVDSSTGKWKVHKPEFFVPFSTGKRTCIGQKLVQGFSFVVLTALLSEYEVCRAQDDLGEYLRPGKVAVPPDPFRLRLEPRQRQQ